MLRQQARCRLRFSLSRILRLARRLNVIIRVGLGRHCDVTKLILGENLLNAEIGDLISREKIGCIHQ